MRTSIFAGVFAALISVAAAWTTPTGDEPTGNPFVSPGLNDIVPAGKPWTVKWHPTSKGTVSLILLRGPGKNIKPLYAIIEKAPNTGEYEWTPSLDLEDDVTRYGIQLIDDDTGAYQYTTQFGVSNKKPSASGSASSSAVPEPSSSAVSSDYDGHHRKPSITYSTKYATETKCNCPNDTKTASVPAGTTIPTPDDTTYDYTPSQNSTTYSVPEPTTGPVSPSESDITPIEESNGASRMAVGGSFLAVAAGLVIALF